MTHVEKLQLSEGYGTRYPSPPSGAVATATPDEHEVEYKYAEVWTATDCDDGTPNNNFERVNRYLAEGWKPLREVPFGGGSESTVSCCLLVLCRRKAVK